MYQSLEVESEFSWAGFTMKSRSAGVGFRHMTVLAAAGTSNLALVAGPAPAQAAAATPDTIRVAQTASGPATAGDDSQANTPRCRLYKIFAGVPAISINSLNVGSSDVQGNNISIRGITPTATPRSTITLCSIIAYSAAVNLREYAQRRERGTLK